MSFGEKKRSNYEKQTDRKVFKTKELFVLKTKWINDVTTKAIEIHDFTMKIKDADKNMKINSPNFKLAGKEFSIGVHPNCKDSKHIKVYIYNHTDDDQMSSATIKEGSGHVRSWKKARILAGNGFGFPPFLSHEKYRELAKINGDVLRLEVVLTLHMKSEAEGDGWTR